MTAPGRVQLWRLAAVALFCGLPVLLAALAIGNLVESSAARALAARQKATAGQIVKEVAKRQAKRLRPEDTAALFLPASSASLARADLQERASRFVDKAGGHLEEAQFTSGADAEADGTVALQLSLRISNDGLRDLLYAIETATPLLEATDLSVKPNNAQTTEGMGDAGLLHVDLTVQGHFRKGTG